MLQSDSAGTGNGCEVMWVNGLKRLCFSEYTLSQLVCLNFLNGQLCNTHTHTHTHKAAITGVVLIIRVPRRCSRLFVLSLDILLEAGQHKREPFCYLQERLSWISVFIASAELVVWCFISQAPCKPMNIIMVFTHAPTATSMVAALQANMSNSIRN